MLLKVTKIVLQGCLQPVLLYACETWSISKLRRFETTGMWFLEKDQINTERNPEEKKNIHPQRRFRITKSNYIYKEKDGKHFMDMS